jgi:hypothetical protein
MINQNKLYLITSVVEAGALETLPVTPSVELMTNDELLQSELQFALHQRICVTSEYSIESVINRLDAVRRNAVESLKDKFKFRELLANIYPVYQYRFIKFRDIKNLSVDKKSVIKPVRGCFGTAVRVIDPHTDFVALSAELEAELIKNAKVYSNYTLSKEDFIVEEFIYGEEYAVDMFYNSDGEPCIVNLFHHPMPKHKAYLHMAYNSSKKVFDEVFDKAKNFLSELNKLLKVKNLAMHVEVKVSNGKVFPVEINPMRFGGMGLGNLIYYSHGVNPYTSFINDCEPDWKNLWKGKEKDVFTFFIAYNGLHKPVEKYRPNREKLKKQFTEVLHEQPFDYQKQLAFGIYFLKETEENISKLLKIDFDDFFENI